MSDAVNQPKHYMKGPAEAIDVIAGVLGADAFRAYCHGNALKYLLRAGHKDDHAQDLAKARVYLGWAIDGRQVETIDATDPAPPIDFVPAEHGNDATHMKYLLDGERDITAGKIYLIVDWPSTRDCAVFDDAGDWRRITPGECVYLRAVERAKC